MRRKIYYMFHSGKNSHVTYYLKAYIRQAIPAVFYRMRLQRELKKFDTYPEEEREALQKRLDYYCKLTPESPIDRPLWEQTAISI